MANWQSFERLFAWQQGEGGFNEWYPKIRSTEAEKVGFELKDNSRIDGLIKTLEWKQVFFFF